MLSGQPHITTPGTLGQLLSCTQCFTTKPICRRLCLTSALRRGLSRCGKIFEGMARVEPGGCIRALLYMCALQARKCNPTCKALFDRLCAKGKPYRVALITVANKLLKQVFAIAKSGQPFQLPLEAV